MDDYLAVGDSTPEAQVRLDHLLIKRPAITQLPIPYSSQFSLHNRLIIDLLFLKTIPGFFAFSQFNDCNILQSV